MAASRSNKHKRILNELTKLREQPNPFFNAEPVDIDNLFDWHAFISGPKGSPYEGGIFHLSILLCDRYPFKPPVVSLVTSIYHCNLSMIVHPKRCSAEQILRWDEDWHPSMTLENLLERIHKLMIEPFYDLAFEPSYPTSRPNLEGGTSQADYEVVVEIFSGECLKLKLDPGDLIESLLLQVSLVDGHHLKTFALVSANGETLPSNRSLHECNISQGETLRMVKLLRNRLETALVDFEIASLYTFDKEKYCQLAHAWTEVYAIALSTDEPSSDPARQSHSALVDLLRSAVAEASNTQHTDMDSEGKASVDLQAHGQEDEEEELSEVQMACPVCGNWYCSSLLGAHLEGHFAFEALESTEVATSSASVSPNSSGVADFDAALAAKLQQEEIRLTLKHFKAIASDRISALRLEAKAEPNTATALAAQKSSSSSSSQQQASVSNTGLKTESGSRNKRQTKPLPQAPTKTQAAARVTRSVVGSRANELMVIRFATAGGKNGDVLEATAEYRAVHSYFCQTLGSRSVHVHSIARVNGDGFNRFKPGTAVRAMFHGCKTLENEKSILQDGFKIKYCISGGQNYGTWFAFNATYSDGGFAFNDSFGIRHLFICLVSNAHVVLENETMRVVGQDCAYPCWIIKYTHSQSKQLGTFRVGPYGRWGQSAAAASSVFAPSGYEVQDGQWVPVKEPPKKK